MAEMVKSGLDIILGNGGTGGGGAMWGQLGQTSGSKISFAPLDVLRFVASCLPCSLMCRCPRCFSKSMPLGTHVWDWGQDVSWRESEQWGLKQGHMSESVASGRQPKEHRTLGWSNFGTCLADVVKVGNESWTLLSAKIWEVTLMRPIHGNL